MTAADVAGGFAHPAAWPLSSQIEQGYLRRVQSLPAETRRLQGAAVTVTHWYHAVLCNGLGRYAS